MQSGLSTDFPGTDRFRVRRKVGQGGMGAVYEAYDTERALRVAVKTLPSLDPSLLYRFKREFRAIAEISHPNLVQIHELHSVGDRWFFSMEFVEGVSFTTWVCPPAEAAPVAAPGWVGASGSVPTTERAATDAAGPGVSGEATRPDTTARGPAPVEAEGDDLPSSSPSSWSSRFPWLEPTTSNPTGDSLPPTSSQTTAAWTDPETTMPDPALGPPSRGEARAPGAHPPFDEARLRDALRQLGEALVFLHAQGKLHRDIKPSNVLVTPRGRVVLLDFGLSTDLTRHEDGQSTTHGQVVGTAAFMSPEQGCGEPLSIASDWYSVGVMLYRALTGQLPFSGRSFDVILQKQAAEAPAPRSIRPDLPDDLNGLCVDLLSRNPQNRPTGLEFLRRLGVTEADHGPESGTGEFPAGIGSRPFVGRGSQMEALSESLAAVREGRTHAVFVHGRSGAGKSTLLQRFLNGVVDRGEAVVLDGRCYEQESVAYKAIDTLIDALTGFLRRLPRHECEALLPRDVEILSRVFPVLRRVEAIAEAPRRSSEIRDPQELRRRAFGALRELCARIGDRKPLILAIDDLQWGDVDSATLLCELLQPPDPPLMMLLCAYRSEYAEESPCLRMILDPEQSGLPDDRRRVIAVDPLDPEESCELALTLLGRNDETAQHEAAMIARESRGSPYFVYELVEHLGAGGEIEPHSTISSNLAVTLDDVLWSRITRLPVVSRTLLEVLAVAGRPLARADACEVAGMGPDGFSALNGLRLGHLVRGLGPGSLDTVETYHDRIRETVVNHLHADRLQALHGQLADTLERVGRADSQTLAVHHDAAGRPEAAAIRYMEAAREASRTLAFDQAWKLFQRALALSLGTDRERGLRKELAQALASAGRSAEAAAEFARVCEDADPAEWRELRRARAFQLLMSGQVDEGLSVYRDLLRSFGLALPETPRQAYRQMIRNRLVLAVRGLGYRERPADQVAPEVRERVDTAQDVALGMTIMDWIRGSSFQTRSLLLALSAGEPQRIALSLGWEIVPSACGGNRSARRTERLIRMSSELADRLQDPHAIGMARMARGAAEFLSSRFRAGVTISDEATAILRERCPGATWERDTSQIFAAWCLFYCGDVAELRARCPRLAKEARERGDRYLETTVSQFPRMLTLLADDNPDEARHLALESISNWTQKGFHVQHLTSFYGQMLTDLYRGDGLAADRLWLATRHELDASLLLEIQHVYVDFLQYTGRVALAAVRQGAEAAPRLQRARWAARRLARQRLPWADGFASLIRGGIASVEGRDDVALSQLRQAVSRLDDAGLHLYAHAARRRLGRLVGGDEGRGLVSQAEKWMASHAIRSPDAIVRAFVSGFPPL